MTNELEKTFFDTFGIEPKEEKYCLWECKEPSLEHVPCNKECKYQRHDIYYPQITDSILLELICICSQYGFCPTVRNIKDLKLKVLKRLFKLKKNLKNNYEHQGYHNAFARKVRTLFEEG